MGYETYLWLKAVHVIAVIAWMAGLLYLPRLYVYHCAVEKGSAQDVLFQTMERRLLKFIMNPAMIVSFVLGLAMLHFSGGLLSQGWMHLKLLAVLILAGMHGAFAVWRKDFVAGRNTRSAKFYRIANEVPTICMIIIVIMAVVKPF